MSRGLPFQFETPIWFFEKAGAPKGQERRIGGIISTELPDFQGETVLADGLDLSYFQKNGWFNDNHEKGMDGIVGYPDPEGIKKFKRGETLPNGKQAPANGIWAEGYVLGNERGNKVWDLAQSLQGTGRQLGYSVEGKILRRTGAKTIMKKAEDGTPTLVGNRVAKAIVRNVAVTHCPVNDATGMEILAKSIRAVELADLDDVEDRLDRLEKALTMGQPPAGNAGPSGPATGEGAGQVITGQSLEQKRKPPLVLAKGDEYEDEEDDDKIKKSLTDAEAVAWVQTVYPTLDAGTAGRIVEITKTLKRQGRL